MRRGCHPLSEFNILACAQVKQIINQAIYSPFTFPLCLFLFSFTRISSDRVYSTHYAAFYTCFCPASITPCLPTPTPPTCPHWDQSEPGNFRQCQQLWAILPLPLLLLWSCNSHHNYTLSSREAIVLFSNFLWEKQNTSLKG